MQLLLVHGPPHGDYSQKCSPKIWKPSRRISSKFKKIKFQEANISVSAKHLCNCQMGYQVVGKY